MLDAAMSIATDEGIEALTIARLCDATHLSIGGLYRYFPSKEAIHQALQERMISRFGAYWQHTLQVSEARLSSAGVPESTAALVHLMTAYIAYLDHAQAAPVEHRLLHSFVSTPTQLLTDEQARHVEGTLGPLIGAYSALFDRAVAAGALLPGDATVRTYLIWTVLHGLDDFRKRDRILPPELQTRGLAETHMLTLLRGWGADPELLTSAWGLWRAGRTVEA